MTRRLLEVCVDDARGLDAAVAGGADRIELCSALALGGLTPSAGLLALARGCPVPVHVLIRPRPGDFCYDDRLVQTMAQDVDAVVQAGLAGVVLGASRPDGRLDGPVLAGLLARARGLSSTLHRVFDLVPDQAEALETAIGLGFDRILTSGGAPTAVQGRQRLQSLVAAAAGRIGILPGSGVTAANAADLLAFVGADEVHASCASASGPPPAQLVALGFAPSVSRFTDGRLVEALRRALDGPSPSEM